MSKKLATIFVAIILLLNVSIVIAKTTNESVTKNERLKIKEELDNVNQEKSTNINEINSYKKLEKKLQEEQDKNDQEISLITNEIIEIDKELESLTDKISQAKKDYKKQMESFEKRLLVMYQNTETSYIELFLNSKDFFEFYQKVDIMTKVTKKDKEILRNLNLAKKEIQYNKEIQKKLKENKETRAAEIKSNISRIMDSQADIKLEINKRMATIEILDKMEVELEKESLNVESIIKGMALMGDYSGGIMLWPVPSSVSITSNFGYRVHPIYGTTRFHSGVDIGASYDSSIVSVNTGVVIYAGWQGGYGNTVIISHGGKITSLYGHCSKLLVATGQSLKSGDIIGKIGSTGASTGNHLHFEIRNDGVPIDPLKYILPQ